MKVLFYQHLRGLQLYIGANTRYCLRWPCPEGDSAYATSMRQAFSSIIILFSLVPQDPHDSFFFSRYSTGSTNLVQDPFRKSEPKKGEKNASRRDVVGPRITHVHMRSKIAGRWNWCRNQFFYSLQGATESGTSPCIKGFDDLFEFRKSVSCCLILYVEFDGHSYNKLINNIFSHVLSAVFPYWIVAPIRKNLHSKPCFRYLLNYMLLLVRLMVQSVNHNTISAGF